MPVLTKRSLGSVLLAVVGLLALSVAIWLAIGPVFLARTVEFTVAAKGAGPKWSLEWLDRDNSPINGVWLEPTPDSAGNFHLDVNQAIPNYRFAKLALRWWEAPGTELSDPGPPRLTERVLWFHFGPELARSEANIDGTKLGHDSFTSTKPDGGAVWLVPQWTGARAIDLAAVCLLMLLGAAAVYGVYSLGSLRAGYNPEVVAIIVVLVVQAWLAVRSPLLFCPDSMDYAVNALRFIEKPEAVLHLNPWRMPGYSIFLIPFLRVATRYSMLLGCAQGVIAVVTALMASRITRAYLSRPWGALTILLVGLDPVLAVWTRHAMPEVLCAFLATLIGWTLVQRDVWARMPVYRSAPAAIGVGLLGAGLCYVRGNYQVLVVLAPFAIGAWAWAAGQPRRGLILGLLAFAGAAGCLAPAIMYNYREYRRAEFVVGSGYTQANSLLEARVLDRNQTGAFSYQEWLQARTSPNDTPGANEFLAQLYGVHDGPIASHSQGLPAWTDQNSRAAAVAHESISRNPDQRWRVSGHAILRLLGLWDPAEGSENDLWSRPMRRTEGDGLTQPYPAPQYAHLQQSKAQDIYDRTAVSTRPWVHSGEASIFDAWFRAGAAVRPLWAALFLIGLGITLARREWSLLILGLIPLAHAAALGILLFDGIDRYQAPLYPLMSVMVCYATGAIAGALRRPDLRGSRTVEDQ